MENDIAFGDRSREAPSDLDTHTETILAGQLHAPGSRKREYHDIASCSDDEVSKCDVSVTTDGASSMEPCAKRPAFSQSSDTTSPVHLSRSNMQSNRKGNHEKQNPVMATLDSGKSVYFPIRSVAATPSVIATLNNISIYEMLRDIREKNEDLFFKQSAKTSEIELKASFKKQQKLQQHKDQDLLWSDKYRPRGYLDLVCEESTSREVLSWIKMWDFCTFGEKKQSALDNSSFQHIRGQQQQLQSHANQSSTGHRNFGSSSFESKHYDHLRRPYRRILLLTGPTGLGKSSLVRTVARHAGYDVEEVNAGDDRTVPAVRERLVNVMTSKTVTTSGELSKRPRLLLFDEIDLASSSASSSMGATSNLGSGDLGFINLLVECAFESFARRQQNSGKEEKTFRKAKIPDLRRPIICVCNDAYVSAALRPLRQVSQIVHIRRPVSLIPLVRRLSFICERENVRAEQHALHHLADFCNADIRACVNAIQISRHHGVLTNPNTNAAKTTGSVAPAVVASCATEIGMFGIFESLFDVRARSRKRVSDLERMVGAYGDYDRLVSACHEYYPELRAHHDLTRVVTMMSDLIFSDTIARKLYPYAAGYQDLVVVRATGLVASASRVRLGFPRAQADARARQRQIAAVLSTLQMTTLSGQPATSLESLNPACVGGISQSERATTLAPMLPMLLQLGNPEPTQTNVTLLREGERRIVALFLERLLALNITLNTHSLKQNFAQNSTQAPSDAGTFDPDVSILAWGTTSKAAGAQRTGPGKSAASAAAEVEAAAQSARAADAEQILWRGSWFLRNPAARSLMSVLEQRARTRLATGLNPVDFLDHSQQENTTENAVSKNSSIVENQRLKQVSGIFSIMTRPGAGKDSQAHSATASGEKRTRAVVYKFNEAFSTAVRKPFLFSDLVGTCSASKVALQEAHTKS